MQIESLITIQEIDWTITKLKLGKTPGTDGLSDEFYKTFKELISAHIQKLFAYCFQFDKVPDTWKLVRLVLILKDGKDPTLPGSYRPISLINVDYKILATILAERLNKVIGSYVVEEKTGLSKWQVYV